jgi:hypothetical protein
MTASETLHATTMILCERIDGNVQIAGDRAYAEGHAGFNVAVTHAPAVVVMAENARDVAEAVRFAAANDMPVAVQATGHGARRPLDGGVLINTSRMTGVTIDPERRTARVLAGTRWGAVVAAAAEHGLAPLNGSSPTVGVVGYTLGGGTGWLARQFGFAADRVTRLELVTDRGREIVASPDENPDLFRAMCGGGGSFAIVTAMEFGLVPVSTVFAGMALYPMAMAAEVVPAFAAWSATMPAEVTSSVTFMRFPPAPMIPEPLRGVEAIIVRSCYSGPDLAEGARLIAPMRAIGGVAPAMDTFGPLPWTQSGTISMDPANPLPHLSTNVLLRDLGPDTIDALVGTLGPDSGTALLMAEVRHVAGAASHADAATAVANRVDAPYVVYAVGVPMAPEMGPVVVGSHAALRAALAPHAVPGAFPNFLGFGDADGEDGDRDAYSAEVWAHLLAVKGAWDPDNRFRHAGGVSLGTL